MAHDETVEPCIDIGRPKSIGATSRDLVPIAIGTAVIGKHKVCYTHGRTEDTCGRRLLIAGHRNSAEGKRIRE